MREQLETILARVNAQYADLRYEDKQEVRVGFQGRDLCEVGSNSTSGYVLRVLHDGGFATAVFNRESDADAAISRAVANAQVLSDRTTNPVRFADVAPVRGDFAPTLVEDPRGVTLEDKLDLVRRMNDIPLAHDRIATTELLYRETNRARWFVSTAGASVREDLVNVALLGTITARDGTLTQNVRVGAGGSDGFGRVRDKDALFERRTRLALALLDARPARAGTYDCILNPNLAGVFAHEAFGHLSEADIVETLPAMRERMHLGARLGSEIVSIVDDPRSPGQLGYYQVDDEGTPPERTQLMKDGVLVGRLHSRRTAAAFEEPPTGHCVAEDYRYPPIVRMGCIRIEPGTEDFDRLVARLGDGLYIFDAKGGQTAGEAFSFGAHGAYVVRGGAVCELIRDVNVSGNLYRTMRGIEAVGDDLTLNEAGACGKGQANIRSCHGSPHILVRGVLVGGV